MNNHSEPFLIVPGLHNSGAGHWQSWLETLLPDTRRVQQPDWETPRLSVWADAVQQTLPDASVWVVAHSFGCLATVAAAREFPHKIRGALLVAPANPERFAIPTHELAGVLPFPTRVVASANDPWMPLDSARHWAKSWGSEFVCVGHLGHINTDSGHGAWPLILEHLQELRDDRRAPYPQNHAQNPVWFSEPDFA